MPLGLSTFFFGLVGDPISFLKLLLILRSTPFFCTNKNRFIKRTGRKMYLCALLHPQCMLTSKCNLPLLWVTASICKEGIRSTNTARTLGELLGDVTLSALLAKLSLRTVLKLVAVLTLGLGLALPSPKAPRFSTAALDMKDTVEESDGSDSNASPLAHIMACSAQPWAPAASSPRISVGESRAAGLRGSWLTAGRAAQLMELLPAAATALMLNAMRPAEGVSGTLGALITVAVPIAVSLPDEGLLAAPARRASSNNGENFFKSTSCEQSLHSNCLERQPHLACRRVRQSHRAAPTSHTVVPT
jgi:hypothetical protein